MKYSSDNGFVLVVALDGADWRILDPLLEAGELPAIASLMSREGGYSAVLESTYPPVTFPAWTTFLTGRSPGHHGVLDFASWRPGSYEVRFSGGGSRRRCPTILEHLSAAGKRVASVSLPGTWPPMDLAGGFVLSGFDAPVAIGPGPDFARPKEIYERAVKEHGPWVYADVDELKVGSGWHERARDRLLVGLARKTRIALSLMEAAPWDLFLVHIGETDTAGHHFYAHHDPASPRRPEVVSPVESRALADIYRAADRFIGALVDRAGERSAVMIASDHGLEGASDRTFHPNRALEGAGLLAFVGDGGGGLAARAEASARQAALRLLPARLKEALVRGLGDTASRIESRRRLSGLDLARSAAFSEELTYAPSIRLNVRGREPMGVIAPEEVDSVKASISSLLTSLRDDRDGEAVVESVRMREEVIEGQSADEAPDIFFVPAAPGGYRYTVLSSGGRRGPVTGRLRGEARLGGKGRGPTGVHRREGVLILAAPDEQIRRSAKETACDGEMPIVPIGACAPTIMSLCGHSPSVEMEWSSLLEAREVAAEGLAPAMHPEVDYTPEQEKIVTGRLRSLGYLD